MHNAIRDEAKRDAAKWQNPGELEFVVWLWQAPLLSTTCTIAHFLPTCAFIPPNPDLGPQATPTAATSSW